MLLFLDEFFKIYRTWENGTYSLQINRNPTILVVILFGTVLVTLYIAKSLEGLQKKSCWHCDGSTVHDVVLVYQWLDVWVGCP